MLTWLTPRMAQRQSSAHANCELEKGRLNPPLQFSQNRAFRHFCGYWMLGTGSLFALAGALPLLKTHRVVTVFDAAAIVLPPYSWLALSRGAIVPTVATASAAVLTAWIEASSPSTGAPRSYPRQACAIFVAVGALTIIGLALALAAALLLCLLLDGLTPVAFLLGMKASVVDVCVGMSHSLLAALVLSGGTLLLKLPNHPAKRSRHALITYFVGLCLAAHVKHLPTSNHRTRRLPAQHV